MKIKSLTGLRAIAAFTVLVGHFQQQLHPGLALHAMKLCGGYGVTLFIILSGFILGYVHKKDFILNLNLKTYLTFLGLRLSRIYSVHIFILLVLAVVYMPVGILTARNSGEICTFYTFLLNVFLLQGWGFTPSWSWNAPSWSISIEWFAYLMFPLLVFNFRKFNLISYSGIVVFLASFYFMVYWPEDGDFTYGRMILQYFVFFCFGYCAYNFSEYLNISPVADCMALLLIASILSCFLMGVSMSIIGPHSLLMVLVLATLIVFLAKSTSFYAFLFGNKVIVYFGETSYSLYMSHVPLIWLYSYLLRHKVIGEYSLELLICIAFAVASLIYHLIEKPARNKIRSFLKKSQTLTPVFKGFESSSLRGNE